MGEIFNSRLCDERHKELADKNDDIIKFLVELKQGWQETHKRLFVDNGHESIQSKINRHDEWIAEQQNGRKPDKEITLSRALLWTGKNWKTVILIIGFAIALFKGDLQKALQITETQTEAKTTAEP